MFLRVLEMVLPVLILLLLGCWCRFRQIFDHGGLMGLKSVISNIALPVVLFNAFFTAKYSLTVAMLFVAVYIGFCDDGRGLRTAPACRAIWKIYALSVVRRRGRYVGIRPLRLLTGEQSGFAAVDLGQTVFAYTAFLAVLKSTDGQTLSARMMLRNMVTNRCFVGMLLGIILGVAGLGTFVAGSPVSGIVFGSISAITAPTSALVLLVVGYELNLKKSLLKPVAITVLSRLILMGILLVMISMLIFSIVPYDKNLHLALMVLYALPAPFIIPLFSDVGKDGEYISTTLSLHTLCTMLLFVAIAAYAVA